MADNKALYRKWRPQVFADLVGQNHVKQTILNAIRQGKVSHAYLFAGPRGTGKTSLARLVAKAVNCLDNQTGEPCGKCANCVALAAGRMIDLIEIDAASRTKVEEMRDLLEKVNFAPSISKYKVYIIDEVHMLSPHSFNALLKTLEEPPAHAIFILATTEVHKLPATVISRCQYFDFHYLSHAEITEQLKKIAKQEKVQVDDEALKMIADNAEGSLRDAISIIDQAASFADGKVDRHVLQDLLGIVDMQVVQELTQSLIDEDAVGGVNLINRVYFKGYDTSQLGKLWLSYLRELLMIKLGNQQLVQKSEDEKQAMVQQAANFTVSSLVNLLQRVVEATNQYKVASLPQLALEMVVVKACGEIRGTRENQLVAKSDKSGESNIPKPLPEVKPVLKTSLSTKDFEQIKTRLWEGVSTASSSLGAVLKTCQLENQGGKLIIKVPSKFLKDTLEKPANKVLLQEQLAKAGGGEGIDIEYVSDALVNNQVETVAEVFGIM